MEKGALWMKKIMLQDIISETTRMSLQKNKEDKKLRFKSQSKLYTHNNKCLVKVSDQKTQGYKA